MIFKNFNSLSNKIKYVICCICILLIPAAYFFTIWTLQNTRVTSSEIVTVASFIFAGIIYCLSDVNSDRTLAVAEKLESVQDDLKSHLLGDRHGFETVFKHLCELLDEAIRLNTPITLHLPLASLGSINLNTYETETCEKSQYQQYLDRLKKVITAGIPIELVLMNFIPENDGHFKDTDFSKFIDKIESSKCPEAENKYSFDAINNTKNAFEALTTIIRTHEQSQISKLQIMTTHYPMGYFAYTANETEFKFLLFNFNLDNLNLCVANNTKNVCSGLYTKTASSKIVMDTIKRCNINSKRNKTILDSDTNAELIKKYKIAFSNISSMLDYEDKDAAYTCINNHLKDFCHEA